MRLRLVTATAAAFLLMAGMAIAQDADAAMAAKTEMQAANVEQHLKDMEQKWAKASLASNGDMLAPMLAEDFMEIDSDGSMRNKTEAVARTTKAKFEVSEIADLQVDQHGDAAIVTGTWMGKGVGR